MTQEDLIALIQTTANSLRVDPLLPVAIARHETNLDSGKCRLEPAWRYFLTPEKYAIQLGVTELTERMFQATSWGSMQVMGSVCRELGFTSHLCHLSQPELGVFYGVKKLQLLGKNYLDEMDVISAYNQGMAEKINGRYKNEKYVQSVKSTLDQLRKS